MLSPSSQTIRLFLHILSASVWVGGQIVIGVLVPRMRRFSADSTKILAQAFARVAWPAFALLVVTGIWNILAVDSTDLSTAYQITMFVHILMGVATAMFAFIHSIGQTKFAIAVGGALGLLTSLVAMFVGILLQTGR